MSWQKVSPYCLQSSCKRFLIAKYFVRGAWLYQLSRGKESLHVGTLADCKAAAR